MSREIRSLLIKSARIQSRIDQEQRRRTPDWITLLRLKVLRLRLKDRLRVLALSPLRRRVPATVAGRPSQSRLSRLMDFFA